MTVISSKEFAVHQEKYFDLAVRENLCIKKGNQMFHLMYSPSDQPVKSESRYGWAKAAEEFVKSGGEEIFFPDFFEDEDLNWWQWKQK